MELIHIGSMKEIIVGFMLIMLAGCADAQTEFKKGKDVEVNVRAFWYKARILEVNGDKYKVHYDGYPSSDDEWVYFTQIRLYGKNAEASCVACTYGPPPGTFTGKSAASEELFKREVYDYYERTITGTTTSPLKVGISFLFYNAKSSYKNTVSNRAGIDAVRKHDGAPVDGMIYPVRVGYIVCKLYANNESERTEVYADFSLFKNREGEWTLSKDN